MPAVLKTIDLTKNFGGLVAVDHVHIEVEPGTVCGLIGPNGSGKSTLINLISGFYRPDSGQVLIDDTPVTYDATHVHVQKGIARTFQHTRVFNGLTVAENVMSGMLYRSKANLFGKVLFSRGSRRDYRENREKALETLAFMGLQDLADMRAGTVPHGQQRMIEIARALATDPKVLLIDEPAAGMTSGEVEHLKRLLVKFRERGLAVVVIEHNTGFVKDVSDHIIVLNFGQLIANGDPAEVLRNPEVISAYLGGGEFA